MLKMYHRHAETGASAAYWEAFGRQGTLADRVRFLEMDPLRPLFRRYLKPGSTMLEGGCGRGQYVAYYTAQGVNVIGLDFARDWLAAIHREAPALRLCAGDVGALPFNTRAFDLYYSGGVVEHFEGGPERALAEARRVLKDDGILLISVPYYSPMRRALAAVKGHEWRRVAGARIEDAHEGRTFYQYAYTVPEFTRLLASAGLCVIGTQGYAVLWGLSDVDVMRRFLERRARRSTAPAPPITVTASNNGHGHAPSLLKRLLVAEDEDVAGAGWLVRWSRWACANMMMFVCTPSRGASA